MKYGPKTALIPINCIIDNATVRSMCSGRRRKPITRDTLMAWRRTRDFPEPIRALGIGEVWDRREVRDWLRENGILGPPGSPTRH